MTTKHTPGPWRVVGKLSGYINGTDGKGEVHVGTVGAYRDKELLPFNRERWDADARLIAAAPDLLEACRFARDGMEASGGWDGDEDVFNLLVTAIAKATGGQP